MDRIKLRDVKRDFARWRAGKRWRAEPVPTTLWAKAVAAAQVHGRTTTARHLGLNHTVLKGHMEKTLAAPHTVQPAPSATAFVELPLAEVFGQQVASEASIELGGASGPRLRVLLRGVKPQEIVAVARGLWEAAQ